MGTKPVPAENKVFIHADMATERLEQDHVGDREVSVPLRVKQIHEPILRSHERRPAVEARMRDKFYRNFSQSTRPSNAKEFFLREVQIILKLYIRVWWVTAIKTSSPNVIF